MRPSWPKGAYVSIAVVLILSGVATLGIYAQTRTSYLAVGFNNGQIAQREEIIKRIEALGPLTDCGAIARGGAPPIEFLSVKTDTVSLVKDPAEGTYRFCRSKW